MFKSPKCDVNLQPNTSGIGPLVGRTSCYRRSVMHILAVILSKLVISSLCVKIFSFGLYGMVDKFVLFQCILVHLLYFNSQRKYKLR